MRTHAKVAIAAVTALALIVFGATAASAEAPTVSIDPPAEVAYTTVKVSGTVDPKDVGTWWSFETSADGGSTWSGFNFEGLAEENTGSQAVSAQLANLTPGTEYQVRLVANNFADPEVASTVETFTTLPVAQPSLSLDPISGITATSAHFEGQINPNAPEAAPVSDPKVEDAFKVTYRFECTPACPDTPDPQVVPAGDQPQTVSFDPTGLVPNTDYTVKLIGSNAGGEVVAEQSFKTGFSAPQVKTGGAYEVEPTSAVLAGRLDPYGQATSYRFEYGTDASYGQVAPADPKPVGSGHAEVSVTRALTGLAPGTTYHYRLVAENATGTSEGEDRTFTTPTSLPARAYELVTPADKQGGQVTYPTTVGNEGGSSGGASYGPSFNRASPEGERIVFPNSMSLGVGQNAQKAISYRSERTAHGWKTEMVSPPPIGDPDVFNGASYWSLASEDLSVGFTITDNDYDPLDQDRLGTLDGMDIYSLRNGAEPTWESRPDGNVIDDASAGFKNDLDLWAVSKTGDAVLFSSSSPHLPGDPLVGGHHIYIRQAGVTRQLDADNDGDSLSACGAMIQNYAPSSSPLWAHTADLSTVAFQVPNTDFSQGTTNDPACLEPSRVYVEHNGEALLASESQRTTPDPDGTQPATFAALSRDGSWVYFRSTEALTDDAPADAVKQLLYRYSLETRELEFVVADVANIQEMTTDGEIIYYATEANDAPLRPELRRREVSMSEDTLVAEMADGTRSDTMSSGTSLISDDGDRFLFFTAVDLLSKNSLGSTQAYLYDATMGILECVSCNAISGNLGGVYLGGDFGKENFTPQARALTPDGRSVVFGTTSRLSARDTNGRTDVYQWVDGRIHLISDGRSNFGSWFFDASEDHSEIFFATDSRLVEEDNDPLRDIYVSKVGGGFGQADEEAAPCEGAGCQGPAPAVGDEPGGTGSFEGAGNAAPGTSNCRGLTQRVSRLADRVKQSEGKAKKRAKRRLAEARRQAAKCRTRSASSDRRGS